MIDAVDPKALFDLAAQVASQDISFEALRYLASEQKSELEDLKKDSSALRSELEAAREKIALMGANVANQSEVSNLRAQVEESNASRIALQSRVEQLQAELRQLKEQAKTAVDETAKSEVEALKARVSVLEKEQRDLEQYNETLLHREEESIMHYATLENELAECKEALARQGPQNESAPTQSVSPIAKRGPFGFDVNESPSGSLGHIGFGEQNVQIPSQPQTVIPPWGDATTQPNSINVTGYTSAGLGQFAQHGSSFAQNGQTATQQLSGYSHASAPGYSQTGSGFHQTSPSLTVPPLWGPGTHKPDPSLNQWNNQYGVPGMPY